MGIFSNSSVMRKYTTTQQQHPLNEVYFGKTPGIQKVFKAFCKFRDKYCDTSKYKKIAQRSPVSVMDFSKDKEYKNLTKELEREFGFEKINLIFIRKDYFNMATLPIIRGDFTKNLIICQDGYKFSKESHVIGLIFCWKRLFFDENFTNGEMFSILLHEIGHNFQQAIFGDLFSLKDIKNTLDVQRKIIEISNKVATQDGYKDTIIDQEIDKLIKTDQMTSFSKYFTKLLKSIDSIGYDDIYEAEKEDDASGIKISRFSLIKFMLYFINKYIEAPLVILGMIIEKGVLSMVYWNYHKYHKEGEKFADSFVGMYGFAPEGFSSEAKMHGLTSFKNKADTDINKVLVDNIPIVSQLNALLLIPLMDLVYLADEHPAGYNRMYSYISQLNIDYNDSRISPETKKLIAKDIIEIRAREKEIEELHKKNTYTASPSDILYVYNKIRYRINGTGPIADLFSATYHKMYKKNNELYYRNLNKSSTKN